MKRIGLRSYIFISFVLLALFVTLASGNLWLASDQLERTAIDMNESVESITASQTVLEYLHIHRRQSLLRDFRDKTSRDAYRSMAEDDLLRSLKTVENYSVESHLRDLAEQTKKAVMDYLRLSGELEQRGVSGDRLYTSTAEAFEFAVTEVSSLIRENEAGALRLERAAVKTSTSYKTWSVGILLIMLAFGAGILGLFYRFIYLPIMDMRKAIDDFLKFKTVPAISNGSLSEISEISQAFHDLVLNLNRQEEQRLVFISSVAHDLKNPLGAIQMSLDILLDPTLGSAEEITPVVSRQVQLLRRLVDDLLDASRIEAGHLEIKKHRQNLNEVLHDSVRLFQSFSQKHKISIELTREPIHLSCDSQRLAQVFNNILSNAIKYSPKGGEVRVELQHSGGFAIVTISDEGIGIDANDLSSIFEPFRRPSANEHQIPGVGLGLSTSRKIIEAHEGWIHVQSVKGKGTAFSITLPVELFSGSILNI